jgi:two-component system chemotaxis response regulator CheY
MMSSQVRSDVPVALPAHCGTAAAADLREGLLRPAEAGAVRVDASAVASLGQAVLQLLLAARRTAEAGSLPFEIGSPSAALSDTLARCGLADALQPLAARSAAGMSKLILTADDSPSMRMLLKASLSAKGFAVETAEDGVEGLERLGQLNPDLLITDINMPRMDGFELIAEVRARSAYSELPILVLSTEFSPEKKARARDAGATGWVTKPFDADKLDTAIRRVCP